MAAFKDLSGQKFNRLTAIKRDGRDNQGGYFWLCQCDCGNTAHIRTYCLTGGVTGSCGCIVKEMKTTHGMSNIDTYSSWKSMKRRCYTVSNKSYKNYGARGITVCDRWRDSFQNFFDDMGYRPNKMSIERIDNDKGYSKENCKWATYAEQNRNRRGNRKITHNGVTMIATDWSLKLGGADNLVSKRLFRGWSEERSVTTKVIK